MGANEGFDEHQLAEMARPHLKEWGLSKDKIYYLFNRDSQIERVKNYQLNRRKFTPIDAKNDIVNDSKIGTTGSQGPSSSVTLSLNSTTPELSHAKEVEVTEFDLKQAWNMGLKEHVKKSQRSTTQVWMVIKVNLN